MTAGLTWIPPVACPCGERHRLGRRYYVSVRESEHGAAVLALGPFLTHPEALAHVDEVRRYVLDHYNPGGRAHWYCYGTAAVPVDFHREPGRLNRELEARRTETATVTKIVKARRRARKAAA